MYGDKVVLTLQNCSYTLIGGHIHVGLLRIHILTENAECYDYKL
jgi:hypothetical protein